MAKCIYCNEQLEKENSVRVPYGKTFRYCCSEDEYQLYVKLQEEKLAELEAQQLEREELKRKKAEAKEQEEIEKAKFADLKDYISYEILDYQKGQAYPNLIIKRVKKLREFYTYEVIKEAFVQSRDAILSGLQFNGIEKEFHKVSYIMAIVEGNINDIYKEMQTRQRTVERTKHSDVDMTTFSAAENVTYKPINKKKSIASFLGEDDL